MVVHDKTTTNKWTYERSHQSLNSYSLVEYNKVYSNTNSRKTLQEESSWQEDFDNLYFWNTLNKTHHGILVWNRNNKLRTINKKHVYKERKETTYVIIRTYVFHRLGTYVTILCNWLIFWQNALYLYLGRSRMCLILQEIRFQVQVLNPYKFVQKSSVKVLLIKAQQLASIEA